MHFAASGIVGSSSPGIIGLTGDARTIGSTVNAGWRSGSLRIPFLFPVNTPTTVRILCMVPNTGVVTPSVVRLQLRSTHYNALAGLTERALIHDIPQPGLWFPGTLYDIALTGGAGSTFPAGTFAVGDYLSLEIQRLGADPADTADVNWRISTNMYLGV